MNEIKLTPSQEKDFFQLFFSELLKSEPDARESGEKVFNEGIQKAEEEHGVKSQVQSLSELNEVFQSLGTDFFEHISIIDYFENFLMGLQQDASNPIETLSASQQYHNFQELKKKFIESEKLNNIQDF